MLKAVPDELIRTYERAMDRIDSQAQKKPKAARAILAFITYAPRPSRVHELQHALAVEVGSSQLNVDNIVPQNLITSLCAGLLTINPDSYIISLVHYTTNSFLRDEELPQKDTVPTIALTCTTYLSFDSLCITSSVSSAKYQALKQQYHLLNFAILMWGHYARMACDKTVYTLATKFLKDRSQFYNSLPVLETCTMDLCAFRRTTWASSWS